MTTTTTTPPPAGRATFPNPLPATLEGLLQALASAEGPHDARPHLAALADYCAENGPKEACMACRWLLANGKLPVKPKPSYVEPHHFHRLFYYVHDDHRKYGGVLDEPEECRIPFTLWRVIKQATSPCVRFHRTRPTSLGSCLLALGEALIVVRRMVLLPGEAD